MKKLNLGCGPKIMTGWDNLDLEPGPGGIVCDLTRGLPYPSNSVDYIFSEHFIEHLTRDAALDLLRECMRVLKPGGAVRFATPDLATAVNDYRYARQDRWISVGFMEQTPCQHLNAGMRSWGHQFLYDWVEFELLFRLAGFTAIQRMPWQVSAKAELTGIETRPFFEDLILEAEKFSGPALPKVTVAMASYNHERYVGRAIESVLNQSMADFEFCITDDGSTDGTRRVIESFQDPRIKFASLEENRGACYALNHAIRRGAANYVAIINSDDLFSPHKLDRQVKYLDENPEIGAVFTGVDFIQSDGMPLASDKQAVAKFATENRSRLEWLTQLYYGGNCLAHPSAMVRKECYIYLGYYDERFRQLPDYLMWLRLLQHWNIHIIEERLTAFRIHDDEGNESAPSAEVLRRCEWEGVQIAKEIMGFRDDDFRFLAKLALPDMPDSQLGGMPREATFAEMALRQNSFAMVEAAIQLMYELSPARGSGGAFHKLKQASTLATLVKHAGLHIVSR